VATADDQARWRDFVGNADAADGEPRNIAIYQCDRRAETAQGDAMAGAVPGEVLRFEHPGAGRRRAKSTPKGREVLPQAKHEIGALLGDRPRDRQYLIEYLHLIQDKWHQISAAHLAALADELRLAFAEVFETATFYAHFDIVKEGEPDLAPLVIRVCESVTCAMFGAEALYAELRALEASDSLGAAARVVRAPCVGLCDQAPVAEVGHHFLHHATASAVLEAVARDDTHPHIPDGTIGYDEYVAGGGYRLLERLRSGALPAEDILAALDGTGLRGMGGAGFPAGRKWRSVRGEPGPRLMAVNGDEGEPGTFKDRHYLNTDPHRFLEGTLIGALVVEAPDVYLYMRDEYPGCPGCTCAGAPGPTSAARKARCWKASRASVACRGTSRPSRTRWACSAARR
jgi:formate dehydrogenase